MTTLSPSYFANTIEQSLSFCELFAKSKEVPKAFSDCIFQRSSGDLQISCRAYTCIGRGEHRIVSIHSAKIEILIWFFYPLAELRLPVYAMQFVRLSGKPMIGVLDMPSLYGIDNNIAKIMQNHILNNVSEPYHSDIPEWYANCRSGYDLFTRPSHNECFITLAEAHLKALNTLNVLKSETLSDEDTIQHAEKIAVYKNHHHLNSPGLSLLNNICGKEWTDRFMTDWLFA
jgi:hypothetical protein